MTRIEKDPQGEKTPKEAPRGRSEFLIALASILSAGSLMYTTYSLLDFFQVGGIDLSSFKLRDISPTGISAAITADIAWTATMVAEYRGVRKDWTYWSSEKTERRVNLVSLVGWIEVLFVTTILAVHGAGMSNEAAAFAAALPLLTKLTWTFAMEDMKDPIKPTPEEQQEISHTRRQAVVAKAKAEAEAEKKRAEMVAENLRRDAEAEELKAEGVRKQLIQKVENDLLLEAQRAENERKMAELKAAHELKALTQRLNMNLQIETLQNSQEIQIMRLRAEDEMRILAPLNTIRGEVLPRSRNEISSGSTVFVSDEIAKHASSSKEAQRIAMVHQFYAANAQANGSLTRKRFCEMTGYQAPRLSEATGEYPVDWFKERGLANWETA